MDSLNIYENVELDIEDLEDLEELEDVQNLEDDQNMRLRLPKRYIRDAQDPFDFYRSHEFRKRYRFSKGGIKYVILPEIVEGLQKCNKRGLPNPPIFQLLICLRFYATASFQLVLSDMGFVSQPTVSRRVYRVTVLIARKFNKYIKMPKSYSIQLENHNLFKDLGRGSRGIGFPSIDGAIDCTHVKLCNVKFQNMNEVYRNRKGYFSLNVQVIVGPKMEIMDIIPEWPGSQHDSRILQNSRIYIRYEQGQLKGMLVGDGGYPALPWLLTPIRNPVNDNEISYNLIHSRTRNIVERTFGVLKRRFPCLSKGLTVKLITSTTIIVACAVLHNISLIFNDVWEVEEDENENNDDIVESAPPHWQPSDVFAVRDALIARLFH
ncbi:putative nuclease HARBI1 [Prorops nasuta]|uniref:putative nuclease HARBI1 n=1 Tax=Prorops nasuta TaxID=863751 RepID=UPI0034CDFB58